MIIVTFLLEQQNEEKEESVSVCLLERVCMNIKVCAYFFVFCKYGGYCLLQCQ